MDARELQLDESRSRCGCGQVRSAPALHRVHTYLPTYIQTYLHTYKYTVIYWYLFVIINIPKLKMHYCGLNDHNTTDSC